MKLVLVYIYIYIYIYKYKKSQFSLSQTIYISETLLTHNVYTFFLYCTYTYIYIHVEIIRHLRNLISLKRHAYTYIII